MKAQQWMLSDCTNQLPAFPKIIQVDGDVSLLNHLQVASNLSLPFEYHGLDASHLVEDAMQLFSLCGENDIPRLMSFYPDELSLYQKRLIGFVRSMLLEPDILLLGDVTEGLSDNEKEKILNWEAVFRMRFPFRTLLHRGKQVQCQMKQGGACE
jgi:ABC-type methionine transport system ATPase subunit